MDKVERKSQEACEVPGEGFSIDNLSLGGLTMPDFDFSGAADLVRQDEAEIQEYLDKYCDAGFDRYLRDNGIRVDYDRDMIFVNAAIFAGGYIPAYGRGNEFQVRMRMKHEARARELYGDRYDELFFHPFGDPCIVDMLIDDAVRTGKWEELPKSLRAEYYRRVGFSK